MVQIDRLDRDQATAMIHDLAGTADRSAGHDPQQNRWGSLYIEELTKMVLESGLLRDAGDRYLTSPRLERSEPGALECHLPKGVMVQRSHDKLNATGSARCKQTGPQPRRAPAAAQTTAQPTS
jgi:hypothetical protein